MYDLMADFYVKSSDAHPRYQVLLGSYYPKTIDELETMGFNIDPDSTSGFLDYLKETAEDELTDLTQPGFNGEIMDVLDASDYEKILLHAYEVDVIDDEGNYPPRAKLLGSTLVTFNGSDPYSPVLFEEQDNLNENGAKPRFEVPMGVLKRHFKVLTMAEVLEQFSALESQPDWTFDKLKQRFHPRTVTPEDLIPLFGMAEYVAFALKDDYEHNKDKNDYDPLVMYVNLNSDNFDFWFDRAHVAGTLAPMSLWDIDPEVQSKYVTKLSEILSHENLGIVLQYLVNTP